MDHHGQARFMSRIRSALGQRAGERRSWTDLPEAAPDEDVATVLETINNRTDAQRLELLERLIGRARPINLNIIPRKNAREVAGAMAALVKEKTPEFTDFKKVAAWNHPLVAKLNLVEAFTKINVPVYYTAPADSRVETEPIRQQVIDAFVGVTSADFCMAETATLVMKTRPGHGRMVSLIPSIHIAVIEIGQIISNLKELYAIVKHDVKHRTEGLTNCMTFISGPSKTADIEGTLVHGAHGPREVHIFVITG